MALTTHQRVLNSTLFLKVSAFIIGYTLWATLSSTQTIHRQYHVPLAFYNVPDTYRIQAPESIQLTLTGKRMYMRTLTPEKLTVHVDAATLKQGENRIRLCDASLFLPSSLEVIDSTPSPLMIHVCS